MMNQFLLLLEYLFHFIPPRKDNVYFQAFGGMYADNPKYISEKLHEKNHKISIYWEMKKSSDFSDVPKYVNIVYENSVLRPFYKSRCKVIVETGAGYHFNYIPEKWKKTIKSKLLLNKEQYNLSTWHGTPIKCIGAQIKGFENWSPLNLITSSNAILSGSKYLSNIIKKAFVGIAPILEYGTPRTDILFVRDEKIKNEIRVKLGIPSGKKVILYAPTFRDSIVDSGVKQISLIDFDSLFSSLNKKFGGSWVFLMRAHPLVQAEVNKILETSIDDRIINGNKHQDMMEYLSIADILLTDYSSSAYDFALTDRICILFAHDRDRYETKDRGLYEPISFLPYPFAHSFSELLDIISNYDKEKERNKITVFQEKIGCFEDGHASERCADHILKILES